MVDGGFEMGGFNRQLRVRTTLGDDQVRTVMRFLKVQSELSPMWRNREMVFLLATVCGLRPNEIEGVRMGDIVISLAEGQRSYVHVSRGKWGSGRDVIIPDIYTRARLGVHDRWRRLAGAVAGDGFVLSKLGRAAGLYTVSAYYKETIELVLGPGTGLRCHCGRHTAITNLLRSGVDIETVSKWAGHKSVATTAIYLHATAFEPKSMWAPGLHRGEEDYSEQNMLDALIQLEAEVPYDAYHRSGQATSLKRRLMKSGVFGRVVDSRLLFNRVFTNVTGGFKWGEWDMLRRKEVLWYCWAARTYLGEEFEYERTEESGDGVAGCGGSGVESGWDEVEGGPSGRVDEGGGLAGGGGSGPGGGGLPEAFSDEGWGVD